MHTERRLIHDGNCQRLLNIFLLDFIEPDGAAHTHTPIQWVDACDYVTNVKENMCISKHLVSSICVWFEIRMYIDLSVYGHTGGSKRSHFTSHCNA